MKELLLYIDPGSGSYLLQAIIAGVLVFCFILRPSGSGSSPSLQKKKRRSFKNDNTTT